MMGALGKGGGWGGQGFVLVLVEILGFYMVLPSWEE